MRGHADIMSQILHNVEELDKTGRLTSAGPEPENPTPSTDGSRGEIISLRDLLVRVARGWKIVLAVTLACVAYNVYSLMNASPMYTIRMVVAPAGTQALAGNRQQGAVSKGLAAFGIPISSRNDAEMERFLQFMKSGRLAGRLQEKFGLLQTIWKGNWDAERNEWIPPQYGFVSSLKNRVTEAFGLPTWTPPTVVTLAGYLGSIDNQILEGDMRAITLTHGDPDFGVWLLTSVFAETDRMMREETVNWTAHKLEYLHEKFESVAIQEYRQALLSLIAAEERHMMLLQSDLPFKVTMIDEPYSSPLPTSPKPVQSLILSLIGGLIIGVALALFVDSMRASPSRSAG